MNTKKGIPSGWNKILLGAELSFQKGRVPKKVSGGTGPPLPYLTPEYLRGNSLPEANYIRNQGVAVEQGDVIILWDGSNAGEVFPAKTGLLSSTMCQVNQKGTFDKKYLYFFLKRAEVAIKSKVKGSGIPHVDQGILSSIYSVIPQSLLEQQKIAEIFSAVDEAIEKTNQLIEKYKRVKQGLMEDLFRYGIDEDGQIRSEKAHHFNNSPLGRIPQEWEIVNFSSLADFIDPQPDHRAPKEVLGGYPYVGIGDFVGEEIDFVGCRKISLGALKKQQKHFIINDGDILFGKIGTIGAPRLLPKTQEPYALNANTILIKPKENNTFVFWLLNSSHAVKAIDDQINKTSQPAFGILKARAMQIPAPKMREERNFLAQSLDGIQGVITREYFYLKKLFSLKNGLMDDLLSGTVRVNHLIQE